MPNTVGEYMGLKKKKDGSWSKSGDPLRTRAATDDYREGMERMGMGSALDRYCRGCGRLPAWCECPVIYGYTCRRCKNPAPTDRLTRVGDEYEHSGECPRFVLAKKGK